MSAEDAVQLRTAEPGVQGPGSTHPLCPQIAPLGAAAAPAAVTHCHLAVRLWQAAYGKEKRLFRPKTDRVCSRFQSGVGG